MKDNIFLLSLSISFKIFNIMLKALKYILTGVIDLIKFVVISVIEANQDDVERSFKSKGISYKQRRALVKLFDENRFYETDDEKKRTYPKISYDEDSGYEISILHSQEIAEVEKMARGMSLILNEDFEHFEHKEGSVYQMIANKLPSIVEYEKVEKDENFLLGVDSLGKSLKMDFGHSPVMLITGASGSGKSVMARVLLEEAKRLGYEAYIADGKGGVDFKQAPKTALYTELEEIAEHYEKMVAEMKRRLEILAAHPTAANWKELDVAWTPIFLLMDEASDFFVPVPKSVDKTRYEQGWRILNAISELARKSRAVGIFQVFSLQAAQADAIPQDIKNNSGFRISYALPTAAMSQSLFESSIAYDNSLRMGKGVFKGTEQEPTIFRGAYIQ